MDVSMLCRSSSDDVQSLSTSSNVTLMDQEKQQQLPPQQPLSQPPQRNDNVPCSLPPIREACAGTISFQQSKKTDFVVLPPLTPTPLTSINTTTQSQPPTDNSNNSVYSDDMNTKESLAEAVATCTFLCQEIEQLRRGWTELTIQDREANLDQLSKAAQGLLYALKQDTITTEDQSTSSLSMETSNLASGTSSPAIATSTTSQREPLSTSPEYVMIRRARNLQDSIGIRQSYRRRAKKTTIGQRCHSCHTTETPEWRRGPDGARTLCNACGLHYSKLIRRGSLTVQRGYSLEDGRSDRSTPPPIPPPPPPRVIEYPIQQDGSPTQLGFPNRVGLGIGSTQTSIAGSNNSQSSSIANQQQQQHSQHHTSFINYMSPPPTEPHHPRDDPP